MKSKSYTYEIAGGAFALLVILGNTWFSYGPNLSDFVEEKAKDRALAKNLAKIEREVAAREAQIKAKEQVSQALQKSESMTPHQRLRLTGYVYDPAANPYPDTRTYLPTDFIRVFDLADSCIGFIYQNEFTFEGDTEGACKFNP